MSAYAGPPIIEHMTSELTNGIPTAKTEPESGM